jgi:hypothetical protein
VFFWKPADVSLSWLKGEPSTFFTKPCPHFSSSQPFYKFLFYLFCTNVHPNAVVTEINVFYFILFDDFIDKA